MEKSKCKLIGTDGNVFALMGKASSALKEAGQPEKAKEMCEQVFRCGSYAAALKVIGEYVEIH